MFPIAEVTAVVTDGVDAEDEESYRRRVVAYAQRRPQGGAYNDYYVWGVEPDGIANIYPYAGSPGQVDVYVESATEVDGIPSNAQLTAVADSIEQPDRIPVGVFLTCYPISRRTFNVTITSLSAPDLETMKDDIEAALEEYFLSKEPYISGLVTTPRKDIVTSSEVSGIVSGIATLASGYFGLVRLYDGVNEIGSYMLATGEKAKLGTVTYD
jgi:uncharacterized phage protein gp47/JayE